VVLQISDQAGCSNSDTVLITFDACLGIDDQNYFSASAFYPNPFNNRVYFTGDEIFSFFIYDDTGKIVESGIHNNKNDSAGESLRPGKYVLKLIHNKSGKSFAIVKEK
jgi:hypothetical protein